MLGLQMQHERTVDDLEVGIEEMPAWKRFLLPKYEHGKHRGGIL